MTARKGAIITFHGGRRGLENGSAPSHCRRRTETPNAAPGAIAETLLARYKGTKYLSCVSRRGGITICYSRAPRLARRISSNVGRFRKALLELGIEDRAGEAASRIARRIIASAKREPKEVKLCETAVDWFMRETVPA
jgi:hypothetical protein